MWASFGSLSIVPWILFAQMSPNMSAVPAITGARPTSKATVEIRDRTEVFSNEAKRRAREALWRIYRKHRTPVYIETVKSLDGAWIADVAGRRARIGKTEQLYILVAAGERDVGVIAARHGLASRLTDQERETIRRAFLGPLQAGETDEALEQGVRAIGTTLDSTLASRQNLNGWNALVLVTIIVAALAIVTRLPEVGMVRGEEPAAGATVPGHVGGSPLTVSTLSRVPQAIPAFDTGEPLRMVRSSAPCREKVGA
jgi:uncharacterized membrane protein YgcG